MGVQRSAVSTEAAQPDEWSANANEALSISLVAPKANELQTLATFHPKFTYPIFGDDETIFGYKDLKINLRFRANDMRPHFMVKYTKKFKAIGETEPADIKSILQENDHLPKVAFASEHDFRNSSAHIPEDWTPPGELQSSFQGVDGIYEVWKGSLANSAIKTLLDRIQIFVPLFIEGGSYIGRYQGSDEETDAPRWTIWFLYRKQPSADDATQSAYTFVGYSTVYRFFFYQTPTPPASPRSDFELPQERIDLASLPCRSRLSQFLVLPPFQGKGNGALLYNAMFQYYLHHEQTRQFPVEDPNEAFDDLRDLCDLTYLRTLPEFNSIKINTTIKIPRTGAAPRDIVPESELEEIRTKSKIAKRQFARVVEMQLMSKLPESVRPGISVTQMGPPASAAQRHEYDLWKLYVKQRLYRHNKELLGQLEQGERIEKLAETVASVEFEYARILDMHARRAKHPDPAATNGKRKLELEDGQMPESKKARVEDA